MNFFHQQQQCEIFERCSENLSFYMYYHIPINVVDSIPHVSLAFKNTACLDDVFKPNQVIFSGPAFWLQNAPNVFDLYTNAIVITLNKSHTLKAPRWKKISVFSSKQPSLEEPFEIFLWQEKTYLQRKSWDLSSLYYCYSPVAPNLGSGITNGPKNNQFFILCLRTY